MSTSIIHALSNWRTPSAESKASKSEADDISWQTDFPVIKFGQKIQKRSPNDTIHLEAHGDDISWDPPQAPMTRKMQATGIRWIFKQISNTYQETTSKIKNWMIDVGVLSWHHRTL